MKNFIKALSLILIILLFSCSQEEPVFAVKRYTDDSYRRVMTHLEVNSQEKVNWSAVFKKAKKRINLGIIVSKREISWIEVYSQSDYVDANKRAVHGIIFDLPPGDYKIMIFNLKNNRELISQEFLVFEDDTGDIISY